VRSRHVSTLVARCDGPPTDATGGQRWILCFQSSGTAPAGPGEGWSAGCDVGSASAGPEISTACSESQNQSSPGSKLCPTGWPVSRKCAVACCSGEVSQQPT